MKLNLGCGFNKIDGYINADKEIICLPDVLVSLDTEPWPWVDDSADEVLLDHVLEHLGETTAQYLHVIKELYRVCMPGAKIIIRVPHPRHDNFIHDCTHVRAITPEGLAMFNKTRNLQQIADGAKDTKLGLMLDVDFNLIKVTYKLEPRWEILTGNKLISNEEMIAVMRAQNNVCYEIEMELTVIKEAKDGELLDS